MPVSLNENKVKRKDLNWLHCNSTFGTNELHSYIIYFLSKPGNECSIVRNISIIENRFTPYTGVGDA